METEAAAPHRPDEVKAWRAAGIVCGFCDGTGLARRTLRYWYHRAWRPPVDQSCWYCNGDGRLDPDEGDD